MQPSAASSSSCERARDDRGTETVQRLPYDGVVVATPVTIPIVRYSTNTAMVDRPRRARGRRARRARPAGYRRAVARQLSPSAPTPDRPPPSISASPALARIRAVGGASGMSPCAAPRGRFSAAMQSSWSASPADTQQFDSFAGCLDLLALRPGPVYPYGSAAPMRAFALITHN